MGPPRGGPLRRDSGLPATCLVTCSRSAPSAGKTLTSSRTGRASLSRCCSATTLHLAGHQEDTSFLRPSCKWLLAWTNICAALRSQSSTPTLMWLGLTDHCRALPPGPLSSLLPCTLPIEEHH